MMIAQLSDPHVRAAGALYQGVADSNTMFAAAVAHLKALEPRPDVVLLSGDLVDEGAAAEYANLRRLLAPLDIPILAIPGNHDEREAFRRCFSDHPYLPASGAVNYACGEHGPVRIVALDVTVPGLHHGVVTEEAGLWLDSTLSAEPTRPTLIMMHHPPFESGIPYMDAYLCRDGDRLAAIVSRHPQVERIVCGHVHRFMQLRFGGTLLCTAPSTVTSIDLQLRPDAPPQSHLEPPALLLHHWRPPAGLVTHLVPIGAFPGPFPFA